MFHWQMHSLSRMCYSGKMTVSVQEVVNSQMMRNKMLGVQGLKCVKATTRLFAQILGETPYPVVWISVRLLLRMTSKELI